MRFVNEIQSSPVAWKFQIQEVVQSYRMHTWGSGKKEAKRTVPIGGTGEDQTEKYSDAVIFFFRTGSVHPWSTMCWREKEKPIPGSSHALGRYLINTLPPLGCCLSGSRTRLWAPWEQDGVPFLYLCSSHWHTNERSQENKCWMKGILLFNMSQMIIWLRFNDYGLILIISLENKTYNYFHRPRWWTLLEGRKKQENFRSMNFCSWFNGSMNTKIRYIRFEMKQCQGNCEVSIQDEEFGSSSWIICFRRIGRASE